MHRTTAASHREGELTLDATEAANPEWAPWLRLLRRARAAPVASWKADLGLAIRRAPDAPLLHEAVIAVDEALFGAWVRELLDAAAAEADDPRSLGDPERIASDALPLLEAAVALDEPRADALAAGHSSDALRLSAIMQLAAMPLLMECRRRVQRELPKGWTQGYCAMCGAWPAFAEVLGLERERRARCGRCAFEWRFDVLRCPYCGEREHDKLAGLIIEGDETRRIDACRTCGGYVKSLATLMSLPDDRVAVRDAESVELDLVAADRGFSRPSGRGFAMTVTVRPRARDGTENDGRSWFLS